MSSRYRRCFIELPFALLLCGTAALAQQGTGSVTGIVTDSAGHAGIADVQISVAPAGSIGTPISRAERRTIAIMSARS